MSCEDIEDCLETSTTINNITNEITNINQTIIQREEDCGCGGGNVLPEPPEDWNGETPSGDSSVCGSAFAIADGIISVIEDTDTANTSSDLADWIANFLFASGGFSVQIALLLWELIDANADVDLITNVQASRAKIAEAFFCALLDRDTARANIVADGTFNANAKTAILAALDCILTAQLEEWAFIGANTLSEACEDFCSWVVVWDFDGSYVPVGDEDLIISGDTWQVAGGTYSPTDGYIGGIDTWTISKDLPPDCKFGEIIHNCNRIPGCQWVDIRKWSGTAWSPSARVINTTPFNQIWGANVQEQSQLKFEHNHGLCGPTPPYGSRTHWVRAEGTGAMPRE